MTLTEFLLARITEDEAIARRFPRNGSHQTSPDEVNDDAGPCPDDCVGHFSGTRLLAECAAKRAAIEAAWGDHCQIENEWGACQSQDQMSAKDDNPEVIEALGVVYADHPDYQQEWRT